MKKHRGFPDGSAVKNLPAMQERQEMQVQSLGQENPLEEERATHSSILAWKSHGQSSLVGYSPKGRKESDTTEQLSMHSHRIKHMGVFNLLRNSLFYTYFLSNLCWNLESFVFILRTLFWKSLTEVFFASYIFTA